jgi:hypothetical protein
MAEVAFEGWAVVELFGHRQRAGYVKDVEMFGGKMLRIDIPVETDKHVTEFYGCSALYALRPCSEEIVRDHIKRAYDIDELRPVRQVEYREREPENFGAHHDDDGEDE